MTDKTEKILFREKELFPEGFLEDLRGLMKIASVSRDADDGYPFGKEVYDALVYTLDLCESFGFSTKFVGKHMGCAEIGEGDEMVGILAHLDVVAAGSGWEYEPFDLTEDHGVLYGQGVTDDKGPAMMMIYALKSLLGSGKTLTRRYRLIFGCSEETGEWEDINKYINEEELPAYGFTPDSDFPLVYAEKGILQVKLSMDKSTSGIISASGGTAVNIVPDTCTITYADGSGCECMVSKTGLSAHGSTPWDGTNAISLAMAECKGRFADFYNTCIGNDWTGRGLGTDKRDEISGSTSLNPGIISATDDIVSIICDIRYPVTFSSDDIIEGIRSVASGYGVSLETLYGEEPSLVDPDMPFVRKLMDAYNTITGDPAEPVVQGGGTYAKAMPNIVTFGPMLPGIECTEHQANEHISTEDLGKIFRIYEEALRIL